MAAFTTVKNLTNVSSAKNILKRQEICKVTIEFTMMKDLTNVLNVTKALVPWDV